MSSADELEFHDAIDAEETLTKVEHIVDDIIEEALFNEGPNEGPNEEEKVIQEALLDETNRGGANTKDAIERFEEQRSKFIEQLEEQEVEAVIGNIEAAVESAVEEALTGPVLTEESEPEFETKRTEFIAKLEGGNRDEIVKNIEWAVANVIDEALVGEECSDSGREYDGSGEDMVGGDTNGAKTVGRDANDEDTAGKDISGGNLNNKKSSDKKLGNSNQEPPKSGNADQECTSSISDIQKHSKSGNDNQRHPKSRDNDHKPSKSRENHQKHPEPENYDKKYPQTTMADQERTRPRSDNQEHSKSIENDHRPSKSRDNDHRPSKSSDIKQNSPKSSGTEQEPPKSREDDHRPSKSSDIKQNSPKSSDVEQNSPKSSNVDQNSPKSSVTKQKSPKSSDIEQNSPKSSGTEQEARKPSEIEQEPSKSSDAKQTPSKSSDAKQKPPKPSEIEQEPSKSSDAKQKPSKSSDAKQKPPKPSDTEQKPQNFSSNNKEPPKPRNNESSEKGQEYSKSDSSTDADRIQILDRLSAAASASSTNSSSSTVSTNNTNNTNNTNSTVPDSYLGSWGGMFSALTGIGSTVSTQVDKIYDALDPNLPETEEDPRSIKTLLDKLSPTNTNVGETSGSWLSGFDKTFDFASDKIGQALIGGIKKLESTVGVTIEPMSSSSSVNEVVYDVDNPDGSSASGVERSSPVSQSGAEGPSPVSQVSRFGKNIYSAGMSTLGKLGRTTADIVVSTKDRITPLLEKDNKIDRSELKKPFAVLFDEFCGNDALEKLQIQSTKAAIQLKSKLKALNPQQLKKVQGELKGVGALLDNIEASEATLEWPDLFSAEEAEMVTKLQDSFAHSLKKMESVDESLTELRENVDAPLPPDMPSLLVYLGRFHMAKMLSAALHLTLLLTKPDETEIHRLATVLWGKIESITRVEEVAGLDYNRRKAALQLLATDVSQAQTTLRDALLTLQPQLRLARLQ